MNHPKPEEWVPFLYGEVKGPARREFQGHLRDCPDCRVQLESWQLNLRQLDEWKLPRRRTRARWFAPRLKWAAAAAVVLVTGFAIGRLSAPAIDVEKLRAGLEPQLRESLRRDMAQMVQEEASRSAATTLAAAAGHAEKLLAAYNTAQESRRSEDLEQVYLAIKKQLDTLAINTQKEFVQLATYSTPAEFSHNSNR
jgi:hypothetical protein